MTIRELIVELQKLDQDMPVCGESETSTWDIEPDELVPTEDVCISGVGPAPDYPAIVSHRYPKALILGYNHR